MIDSDWILRELKRTLDLLCAPASEQIAYLDINHVHEDELALGFDAVAPVAPALVEMGNLTPQQAHAIRAVDQELSSMSGSAHADLWSDDGIETSPEWARVRSLAAAALEQLEG